MESDQSTSAQRWRDWHTCLVEQPYMLTCGPPTMAFSRRIRPWKEAAQYPADGREGHDLSDDVLAPAQPFYSCTHSLRLCLTSSSSFSSLLLFFSTFFSPSLYYVSPLLLLLPLFLPFSLFSTSPTPSSISLSFSPSFSLVQTQEKGRVLAGKEKR